jgi:dienelactone hydrolase
MRASLCRAALAAALSLAPCLDEMLPSAVAWTSSTPPLIPWDYDTASDGPVRTANYTGSTSSYTGPKIELPGRLYVPSSYATGTSFALVIFLHGSGETYQYNESTSQATQLDRHLANNAADNIIQNAIDRQFFFYAPQYQAQSDLTSWKWTPVHRMVVKVAETLKAFPKIDPKRIYVTGLSAGGGGTRTCMSNYADVFAAGVPIASGKSGSEESFYAVMHSKPMWIFHARDDSKVPPSGSRRLVDDMRIAVGKTPITNWPISTPGHPFYNNGSPYYSVTSSGTTTFLSSMSVSNFDSPKTRYTEYPDGGHGEDTWGRAWGESELWDWLLSQELADVPQPPAVGDTLLFDFGTYCLSADPPWKDGNTGFYWNSTVSSEELTKGPSMSGSNNHLIFSNAATSTAKRTSVSMELISLFGSRYSNGPSSGGPYSNFKIASDGWYTVKNATATSNPGILRFAGLTPNGTYEVKVWAGHTDSDGTNGRHTCYEIGGQTRTLAVYSGSGNYPTATFETVTASSTGVLDLKVYPQPGTTSKRGVLSTVEIKALGSGGDTTSPTVTITAPVTSGTYHTADSPLITLSGTASDNVGVTSVAWVNDRGGSGSATGTITWSVPGITLQTGTNVITVTASDAASNTGTATLNVIYNIPPVAVVDSGTLNEGTTHELDVLANDSDPDAWPQAQPTLSSVGTPQNGAATLTGGKVKYTPAPGFYGTDSVTYTISDGLAIATGTAHFTVLDTSLAHELPGFSGSIVGTNASGSSRVLEDESWEINGTGSGPGGTADALYYESTNLSGAFQAFVNVRSLASSGTAARAGVMLRESGTANARMIYIATTTGSNFKVGSRVATGSGASETTPSMTYAYPDPWLMLRRVGDAVSVFSSNDGTNFVQSASFALSGLPASVQFGVFSAGGSPGVHARAVMQDFEITNVPVFAQDFSSSSSYSDYFNASSPEDNQFNDISAEVNGGTWSINGGRLQLVRTGSSGSSNGAGFSRWTNFAGPPNVLHVCFDLSISNFNSYQNDALSFTLISASGFQDYNSVAPFNNTFGGLNIDGAGSNNFQFEISGTKSSSYAANGNVYSIELFLNKSGSAQTYNAPDGTVHTLNDASISLWVNSTSVLENISAPNGSASSLSDIRARFP